MPVCGVNWGVGKGPRWGRVGRVYSSALASRGDGSSVRMMLYESEEMGSLEFDGGDDGDSSSRTGNGGGLISESSGPGELYPESFDISPNPKGTVSSSGVRMGTIVFHVWGAAEEALGETLT